MKKLYIIFAIIMGIFMLLFDLFWSLNQWVLVCLSGIGIIAAIVLLLRISKK